MPERVRFGAFEFEAETLELYKHGIRVKLQEQPSRVLAALVASPGEIVSRERLQQELWPDASFGEFEAGLNTALSKLRAVLGDSAASPIYIERVPRQGYRFVAPLRGNPEVVGKAGREAGLGAGREVVLGASGAKLEAGLESSGPDRRRLNPAIWVLAGAVLAGAVLAGVVASAGLAAWNWGSPGKPRGTTMRFTIHLPAEQELVVGRTVGRAVGISDDGTTLGYLATAGGTTQVYVRKLADAEFRVVPGTQGATDFALSPDGRQLLFQVQAGWMKMDVSGANLRTVGGKGRRPEAGAIWGEGDAIYAPSTLGQGETEAATNAFAIFRMAPGKSPERLTPKPDGKSPTYYPEQLLPDGRHMLVGGHTGPTARWVGTVPLGGGKSTPVVEPAMGGHYLDSGHLVYFWRDALIAAPFDLAAMKTVGPGVPVVNGVAVNQWIGSQSAISSNGTLAYIPKPSSNRMLVWVNRSGEETALEVPPGPYVFLSLSPSGSRFLVYREDGDQSGIWMYDQKPGGRWTRLVAGVWPTTSAAWSPDEKSLAFSATLQGEQFENLYVMRLDPPGGPERVAPSAYGQFVQSWTARAGLIYTESDKPGTHIDLLRLTWKDGAPHSEPLVTTAGHDSHGSVSPDGRWLAYTSARDDKAFVYVRPLGAGVAGSGAGVAAVNVTPDGGTSALWSPAGDEIFYRRRNAIWSVPVKEGKPAGAARRLFGTTSSGRVWNREFGVTGDGMRFLITKPASDAEDRRKIHVVLNWTSELEQLVPPRR